MRTIGGQNEKAARCRDCDLILDLMSNTLSGALVLPKQFLGKGYTQWFAIAFPELFVCALSF